ncbi:MAG: formylglycine-generating enzyme family protein [Fidelibacterota bacterium]|nr:MAG: formylglycine-generating enzyme family protein [Candidatus Neomarinimicrobiota bacterium]
MPHFSFPLKSLIPLALIFGSASFTPAQTTQDQNPVEKPPSGMVLIPGGEFRMGKGVMGEHSPVHKVTIDSFYMDKYEVTNIEYYEFCQQTDRKLPEFWGMQAFHSGPDFPDHPVVGVSWSDATAYAKWASKRLPTEAEWEYAARGGLAGKDYPNGNDLDTTLANYSWKGITRGTMHIGSYAANGYGLYDMVGNVVEWVADYYDGSYYRKSPRRNPPGPKEGKFRVIRGGGWHSGPGCTRVYFRNALPGNWLDFNVGFRCAKDVR